MKLVDYLRNEVKAISATIIAGPNGDFISWVSQEGVQNTIPVGKKSQGASDFSKFNVLITDDGVAIATVNNYKEVATMAF